MYNVGYEIEGIVWSYRDLTERREAETSLSIRLRYEEALSDCSRILFAYQTSESALNDALTLILQASHVSRVYIFENEDDDSLGICVNQTHEVCAEGVVPQIDNPLLQRFPLANGFQRWIDTLSKGESIRGSVAAFPESEREALQMQGIVSILILPIFVKGTWQGMIGFDDVYLEREWSDDDVRLLRMVADMVGVYIEGQRRGIDRLEYEFNSKPSIDAKSISAELWDKYKITIFRINSEGIVSHVEGDAAPFNEPIFGRHYARVFAKYAHEVDRAWKSGHSIFSTWADEPIREIMLKRDTDETGENMLDGGIRLKFEGPGHCESHKELIGIVSHELRNPLASILGALKLLNSGTAGDLSEKAKSLIHIASDNGERLLHLLNDIVDVEKIETGTLDFQFEISDMSATVRESVLLNEAFAQQYNVSLEHLAGQDTVMVRMDRGRILQVLTNLISNAVKFSDDGGSVKIGVYTESTKVRVEVADCGPGIPLEFQPRIFEKFAHREPHNGKISAGAGLGLSISKAIIERHDGDIGFESEPGNGTVFYFMLERANVPPVIEVP
jgi:signal transduction histidine kinase